MRNRFRYLVFVWAAAILFAAVPSFALGRLQGYVERGGTSVLTTLTGTTTNAQGSYPGATVTVYNAGTLTLSPIYSSSALVAKANPFTADSKGLWFFYAADGEYDVKFSGAGITVPWTVSALRIVSGATSSVFNVTTFGASCTAGDDDSTAFAAASAAAAAAHGGVVYIPPNCTIGVTQQNVPAYVSILGGDMATSVIESRETSNVNPFLHLSGSFVSVRNLTIDGKKANQTAITTSTLMFTKGNSTTSNGGPACPGGGNCVAGGLIISSGCASGTSSCVFTLATVGGTDLTPILPGDVISFVKNNGSAWENLRVSKTYTTGSTTVTFDDVFTSSYVAADYATLAVTDTVVEDVTIKAAYRDALTCWHCYNAKWNRVVALGAVDTGLDFPDGGNTLNKVTNSFAESAGRYPFAIDQVSVQFPPSVGNRFENCSFKLLDSVTEYDTLAHSGQAFYGYVGPTTLDSTKPTVTVTDTSLIGNTFDTSRVRANRAWNNTGDAGLQCSIGGCIGLVATGNHFYGFKVGGGTRLKAGISHGAGALAGTARAQPHIAITDNDFHDLTRGITFNSVGAAVAEDGVISNNTFYNANDYCVFIQYNTANIQNWVVSGNICTGDGASPVFGFVFNGNLNVNASLGQFIGNVGTGTTGGALFVGTGWNIYPEIDTSVIKTPLLQLYSIVNGNLPAAVNGSIYYCSDCTIANPCVGGGTGAIAKRLNGAWVCN